MVNESQTQIWQLCLICADLHCFFSLSNHLSSQANGGCHGDHWPAQRVIKGLDLLWLQSLDARLKKSWMLAGTQPRTEIRWLIQRYGCSPTTTLGDRAPQIYDHLPKIHDPPGVFKRSFPLFSLLFFYVVFDVGSHYTYHTPSLTPLPITNYRSVQQ